MRLRDLLASPRLGLTLLTGTEHLDRTIRWVYTTDLRDPRRYLSGGEVVLTGLMWRRDAADSEAFVSALASSGVAALGAGNAALGSVPPDLIAACSRHDLPLFEVPEDVSFRDITETILAAVAPSLWSERAAGLATQLDRQRDLVTAVASGAGLQDLLPPAAARLGLSCWVMTATGRVIAGTGVLPAEVRGLIAQRYLTLERLPQTVTVRGAQEFTLFPVGPSGAADRRLTGWFLTFASPEPGAPPVSREAADELLTLVTLEWTRVRERRAVERRLATELLRCLVSTVDLGELRAHLLTYGIGVEETFLVAVATVTAEGTDPALPDQRVSDQRGEPLAVGILDELVDGPRAVVAGMQEEAVAILPVPAGEGEKSIAALRSRAQSLEPGLPPRRLWLGISGPATGAAALRGAWEEARHAHRLAVIGARSGGDGAVGPVRDAFGAGASGAGVRTSGSSGARPGRWVTVVSGDELTSHTLLLAAIPEATRRSFHSRLLQPLLEYDRTHGAELVRTLDTFLRCSGSWSRCARLLHVHPNTLRYRINRIQELTGRSIATFADRVDFFLALQVAPDAPPVGHPETPAR